MSAAVSVSQGAASKFATSAYETAATAGVTLNEKIIQGVLYSRQLSSKGAEITYDATNKGKEIGLDAASKGIFEGSEQLAFL